MNEVREFWTEQAKKYGSSSAATSPDHFYRELEIERIIPEIRGRVVLDVGCGNGYSTSRFANTYLDKRFVGIDYSDAMIAEARKITGDNLSFEIMDVRNIPEEPQYDCIISERCLINLSDWDEQQDVLDLLRDRLTDRGRLILVENMRDGLSALNMLRKKFDLPPIRERWHNCYMSLAKVKSYIAENFDFYEVKNIGNLYYIISRVVHAKLAQLEGREPEYDHPINAIASLLPSLEKCHYSPNYMIICDK